ncbi:hypothetical protein J2S09_005647 [Bacillus fengqiuensis]|nr:hypothetical protein [Bacillus fengqiuensis]MDQ0247950.1 hypothetical protein [Bacillus fengqiuensis]
MKRIDGGKDCALTWGGLTGKPSTLGNPFSDEWLNSQKSAEVIVLYLLEKIKEGPNN